ncbi:MAG: glycosyltransferase family 2 protein [Candidatus Melainabacteria bacterium]|nr:glycosyltransferase family 2 protein [Candidatus Melainabacteria bacterium]
MKSIFYCPVYNQINELPNFLEQLRQHKYCDTVLLVNNGSTDGSEELIKKSGFPHIEIPQNLGVGYSYILALDWAIERNYKIFGTIASNGKMLSEEMGKILEPVLKDKADYITGSRFLKGGTSPNLPLFRRYGIPLVNIFVKLITGIQLTDATCGYRAFNLDIIRKAKFNWHAKWLYTYSFEYYLYAKVLLNSKIRWKEVPITMNYPSLGKNYSKIRPIIDWWPMLKPWLIAKIDGKNIEW